MNPNYAFLAWVVIGAAAGWLGCKLIWFEKSALSDIVVGMTGAAAGGALSTLTLGRLDAGVAMQSLIVSAVGACLMIAVWRMVKRRTAFR